MYNINFQHLLYSLAVLFVFVLEAQAIAHCFSLPFYVTGPMYSLD